MADNLKDLNRQLSNAKNELSNYQGALDKLRASLDKTKRGTPRYQSITAQIDRAIADVRNAETKVRTLQDRVTSVSAKTKADTEQSKLEENLQRAKDKQDPAAIQKAQSALDSYTKKTAGEWKPGMPWDPKYLKPGDATPQFDPNMIPPGATKSGPQTTDYTYGDEQTFKDGKEWSKNPTTGVWGYYETDAAKKYFAKKTPTPTPTKTTPTKTTPTPTPTPTPAPAQTTEQKTSDAIAKAIELYQMPDIIFANVPELKTILDKYLDPKAPITLNQFLKEVSNSTWYRQNSGEIKSRYLQKFNYDDLKKRGLAKGDTQYEQDIKSIANQVIAEGRRLGAPVDPAQAQLIAEDLYIHNMEKDTAALTKRLAGSIRVQPLGITGVKGYTGQAQADYQKLLALAKNNGLDLNVILPARVSGATKDEITNNVLAGLADGSLDVSAIQQTARMMAAQGQPQYVKDLLAQGYDLAQIYSPYKKIMSTVLELNPDQIDLNDPTLRSAITNQGDMNTYDFQKSLRKDPRWQYTQNAKQTVSDSVLGVLKDFGFQG